MTADPLREALEEIAGQFVEGQRKTYRNPDAAMDHIREVARAALAAHQQEPVPLAVNPLPVVGGDERLYRVEVQGGGSFLYDLTDVGRFAKEMAQQDDCRSFSVRRVTVDRDEGEGT